MSVANENISFYEGNIQTLALTIINSDAADAALDLTNLTLKFALSKASDLDPLTYSVLPKLEKTEGSGITVTNAIGGLCEVELLSADTEPDNLNGIRPGNYYWELEATDLSLERTVLATGTFTILKNVVNS